MSYWRARLPTVTRAAAEFQMNLTFLEEGGGSSLRHRSGRRGASSSSLAVYGRRGAPPSVTRYDWAHIVSEDGAERRYVAKRSTAGASDAVALVTIERSLSRGDWFIAVLNDDEGGQSR